MKRIKKIARWIDDRSGISELMRPLLKHPVPPGTGWKYVFGSATLFCFILQIVTGVALALMYQPSSDKAFNSLQYITNQATLGKMLRGLHYFGASGMILMVGIHMLRVYITASYKFPREMQWVTGVLLLILTTAMGFTGQLLRWDDNGIWSAVVAAEQMGRIPLIGKYMARLLMGGDTLGGQTLSRFFDFHVFLFPALIMMVVGYHLWMVIRNGISEPPKKSCWVDPKTYRKKYERMLKEKGISFWPYVAWRDAVFGVGVLMIIIGLALLWGPPPISKAPDPSMVYTTPQPDWYLLWVYALFALMPPSIESYVIFFGPIVFFTLLFALPFLSNKGERSPVKRPWAIAGSIAVVVIVGSLLTVGVKANWSPKFKVEMLPPKAVHSTDTTVIAGARLFYEKGCLYCHKISTYGGKVGPELTHAGLRLTDQEMQIRIINGSKDMPAFAQSLTNDELQKLIAFLHSRR